VLGPSPTYDQTPTQTAAATTQKTSGVQEDPKTPGYSTRDFLMNFMRGQLQALKTNKNDLIDDYLKGAEANNISANKAIEFFGGFD